MSLRSVAIATTVPPTTTAGTAALDLRESLKLWEEAERVIPGGSQTNSKRPAAFAFGKYPIFAARAEGCGIWDVDGNAYVDFVNGLGPITLGYGYPAVDAAVRAQLEQGIVSGLLWPVEVAAARGLVEAIPCAESVRFFKGGGEATAAAARIARAATGRHVILNAGYRGWPDTWSAGRDAAVPPDIARYTLSFTAGDLIQLERLLEENRGQVAAVFTDVPYDASLDAAYLHCAKRLAHDHGALLCFDEIVNGFRLARGGMQEHFGVDDGDTTADEQMSVQVVNGCLGVCDLAPIVKLDDAYHGPVTPESLTVLVNQAIAGRRAMKVKEERNGEPDADHAV